MVSDFSQLPFLPGETLYHGNTAVVEATSTQLEGKEYWIEDKDWSSNPVKERAYGPTGYRKVRVHRNTSGIAILPGMLVQTTSAHFKRRIAGYSAVAKAKNIFPVDEFLHATNGCPNNDLCYVVTEGYAGFRVSVTPAEAVITAGSEIFSVTAAASTFSTTAGRGYGLAAVDASTTFPADQISNAIGVAISASTTNNTDSIRLMYVYGK